jgi:hypothetical protein
MYVKRLYDFHVDKAIKDISTYGTFKLFNYAV